jgi:hypothetical protein
MKNIIKKLLLKLNFSITKVVSKSDLDFFFKSIKPITTNKKLIRIGGEFDAGYLIPDDLIGIQNCFSPGVSIEAYFENELAEKYGIKSFMADYSVEDSPIKNMMLSFKKAFIGFENRENYISLENWISECSLDQDTDMILQMDIEGGEYNVIIETDNKIFDKFRIIIIEFHMFDQVFNKSGHQLIASCFYKLLKSFEIVHIHPNNCSDTVVHDTYEVPPVIEFTFLRKDRIGKKMFTNEFPNKLDKDNQPNKKSIILPRCFFEN